MRACAGPAWWSLCVGLCGSGWSNPACRKVSLLKIMERSLRGGPQNRAHLCVFPLFLISGFGKRDVGLNKGGRLLTSTVLCYSDLWLNSPQSADLATGWSGKSLERSCSIKFQVIGFVFRSPFQNDCGINPKDEGFSLSTEARGHLSKHPPVFCFSMKDSGLLNF